jgi:hypothetical protein
LCGILQRVALNAFHAVNQAQDRPSTPVLSPLPHKSLCSPLAEDGQAEWIHLIPESRISLNDYVDKKSAIYAKA